MSCNPEIDDDQFDSLVGLIAVDRFEGLKKLQKLAEEGNRWAVLQLGLYLSEDEETTEQALPWLRIANDFDSADAAWNLAMIAKERGLFDEMKQWIDRASDLGEEDATNIRTNGYDVDAFLRKLR